MHGEDRSTMDEFTFWELVHSHDCRIKDVRAAQSTIDVSINELERTAERLKRRRNAIVPFVRLPVEILAKIFHALVCIQEMKSEFRLRMLIKITSVCSRWRAVALESPDLWTCIPLAHPEWAKEMLRRSKTAPLIILVDYALSTRLDKLHLALRELSRIQKFIFCGQQEALRVALRSASVGQMPSCLTYLSLHRYPPGESEFESENVGSLLAQTFPAAPLLQHLELVDCPLRWDSPLLQSGRHDIVSLKLHLSWIQVLSTPSTNMFISALRKMPRLEHLDLSNTLPSDHLVVGEPCVLSHLSHIRLQCSSLLDCLYALQNLVYPERAVVAIKCFNSCNVVPQAVRECVHPSIRCAYLEGGFSGSPWQERFWLRTWYSPEPKDDDLQLDINIRSNYFHRAQQSQFDSVGEMISSLPLENLQSMYIYTSVIREKDWLDVFSRLGRLQSLSIRQSRDDLINMLSAPCSMTGVATSSTSFLPSLKRLAISNLHFKTGETGSRLSGFEAFLEFLRARKMQGIGIEKLDLSSNDLSLSEEKIAKLRSLVPAVRWRGPDSDSESSL